MKTRKTFAENALPEIRTGFILRDGGISVFHDTVYDFETDRDDIDLAMSAEDILDSYLHFIPFNVHGEDETWYVAPEGIDHLALFPNNPETRADVVLGFDAYKSENNFFLSEIPLHIIGHRDFIRLDILPIQTAPNPYFDGSYIFNKAKLATLLENQDWASHYVFAEPGHQTKLLRRLRKETGITERLEAGSP